MDWQEDLIQGNQTREGIKQAREGILGMPAGNNQKNSIHYIRFIYTESNNYVFTHYKEKSISITAHKCLV